MSEDKKDDSIELMKMALSECQSTVKAYDTKAQIVGVGYIFALNIIFQLAKLLPHGDNEINLLFVIIAWSVMIFPIALFGFVLHPTRKTVKHLKSQSSKVVRSLYLEPECYVDLQDYIEKTKNANLKDELAFELFKVSSLRELKRNRFLRALFAAGLAFVVLFVGQLVRVAIYS